MGEWYEWEWVWQINVVWIIDGRQVLYVNDQLMCVNVIIIVLIVNVFLIVYLS